VDLLYVAQFARASVVSMMAGADFSLDFRRGKTVNGQLLPLGLVYEPAAIVSTRGMNAGWQWGFKPAGMHPHAKQSLECCVDEGGTGHGVGRKLSVSIGASGMLPGHRAATGISRDGNISAEYRHAVA